MNVFCVVIDHFCYRQQFFFHNFSLTTLMTHGKPRVDDKKSPTREVVDYILHRLSTALNINSDIGFQKLLKYMCVAGKPNSLT